MNERELSPEDEKIRNRLISAVSKLAIEIGNEHRTPPSEQPATLYHYTDAQGLIGILTDARLHVSRGVCLNDPNELAYGEGVVRAVLERRAQEFDKDEPTLLGYFNKAAAEFRGFSADPDETRRGPHEVRLDPFVTSFSSVPDLLGLWAYYAREGGYCIGFRRDSLANLRDGGDKDVDRGRTPTQKGNVEKPFELRQIIYREPEQRAWIVSVVERFEKLLGEDLKAEAEAAPGGAVGVAARSIWLALRALSVQMKAPGFEAEQEWRLVSFLQEWVGGDEQSVADAKRMRFRRRGGRIIPYLRAAFEPGDAPICSITSGPTVDPRIAKDSITRILKSNGYPWKDIDVRASAITLRE